MATRTLKFMGIGYGASPASIQCTADGNAIFTGNVATVNEPLPNLPADMDSVPVQSLFTMEVDTSFNGNIAMSYTVNSGTVLFGVVEANYNQIMNPVYTAEDIAILGNPATTRSQALTVYASVANPPFTPEEMAVLEDPNTPNSEFYGIVNAHGCAILISSGSTGFGGLRGFTDAESRSSVYINGVEQNPQPRDLDGTWWWILPAGSTMTYQQAVPAGTV